MTFRIPSELQAAVGREPDQNLVIVDVHLSDVGAVLNKIVRSSGFFS